MDTPTSTRPSTILRVSVTTSRTGNKIPTQPPVNAQIRIEPIRTTNIRPLPNLTPVALNPPVPNRSSSTSSGTPSSQRVEHPYSLPPAHQYTNNQISLSANTSNTPQKCDNTGGVQFSYEMTQTRQEGTINRYWISAKQRPLSASLASKTPISYRHLIDLTSSNIQCTDTVTGQEFLCKIVNEPMHKVQRAYFALKQDSEGLRSTIYGHTLIRGVHDIVPLSSNRTYIIISPKTEPVPNPWDSKPAHDIYNNGIDNFNVYEDLHTYIRNKERLCEAEARYLFHQICQTVQVCHRNGIILRDLKLKRFFFIDEARTKLQYESLEGSMILSDLNSDVLSDKIGCPLYTAPELLCPNPTYHGKPADMWSLGVILYTMLVGQYPFYEKGNCNLITVIRHCHVQIPSSLSRSVRWLLLALLRKNYEERMTASQIFVSPWLKEQRPFYTYIPVDVEMSDSEYEDDVEENDNETDVSMDSDELINEDDTDLAVEPLDYTSATLSGASSNKNATPSNNNATPSNNNATPSNRNGSTSSESTTTSLHVRSPNINTNAYQNIEMDPIGVSSVVHSSTGFPSVRLTSSYNCVPSTSHNNNGNSDSEIGPSPYGFPTVGRSNTGLPTMVTATPNIDIGNYTSL